MGILTEKNPISGSDTGSDALFLYLSCRKGSVPALKAEMLRRFPALRFSFSCGGFLTYKIPESEQSRAGEPFAKAIEKLVFARTAAFSIGKPIVPEIPRFWEAVDPVLCEYIQNKGNTPFFIHVWEPDTASAEGEPAISPACRKVFAELTAAVPKKWERCLEKTDTAVRGSLVLDVVRVNEKQWWLGHHTADGLHSRYPGGLFPLTMPEDAASRAWLKFEEGIVWSEFPIVIGSRCADIGAAPGGGSQALLSRGAEVLGVDPAQMAPQVIQNPNFTHLRGRINQIKRNSFRKTRWIIADMNVAPRYTLEALEEIVLRDQTAVRGMIFTLKLFELSQAADMPEYIRRIKSWGFNKVKVRQLTFNHQEVMAAALKKPFRA